MRTLITLPATLSVLVLSAAAVAQDTMTTKPPSTTGVAVTETVTRYTERPLSEFQTRVMNEATKLSFACRYFRNLYGRWPSDIAEIQSKTVGIDYEIFLGRAKVTPLPDDAEQIEIFDGVNVRSTKAVPVQMNVTPEIRAAAQQPDFKIKF